MNLPFESLHVGREYEGALDARNAIPLMAIIIRRVIFNPRSFIGLEVMLSTLPL